MLPAITQSQVRQQGAATSRSVSIPAPIGGLNTRSNIGSMQDTDAVKLINMIPGSGGVASRNGYIDHLSGLDGVVGTIAEFRTSSSQYMVVAAGSKIYRATSTAESHTEVGTGYSSSRWQTAMHNAKLLLVNGVDDPQEFDGTSCSAISLSGTGLTASNINNVMIHINRAFYAESAAPHFWYATTAGGYSGTLAKFDLSQYSERGGNIAMMASWSRDGGSGPDDYAVFFMTSGEVVVFAGIDPGDANSWAVVGRYYIGGAFDPRNVVKAGADLYVLSKSDFVPMTEVLSRGRIVDGITNLTGAASNAARLYSQNAGWQTILYSRGNLLFFNVPVNASTFRQYGISTQTGAAFEFRGWNSPAFGVAFDRLYMGLGSAVKLCDEGQKDGMSAIEIEVQQAYTSAGDANRKQAALFSPNILADGNVTINIGISYDYSEARLTQNIGSESGGVSYDEEFYDTVFWSPESQLRNDWFSAAGFGRFFSIRMKAALLNQSLTWYRTDYIYKTMTGI